jgi:hypothetical protein
MAPFALVLTDHARLRMQQRGVRREVVELLLQFGSRAYDGHGAQIRYFDGRACKRIRRAMGDEALRRYHDRLDSYAVVANDGQIVTVGHRYRRRRRR